MKYISYYVFIIFTFLILLIFSNYEVNKTHTIFGKTASNNEELRIGLMFRKNKLKRNEGMLFPFISSVWMKNTYIPLDIIFLNNSMKVIDYYKNTIPLSTKSIRSSKNNAHILEMNSGSIHKLNININDDINFIQIN